MKARQFIARQVVATVMVAVRAAAADAATVREANIDVVFSPGACDVSLHFAVDTADPSWIEHRLMLNDEGRVPAFVVTGAVGGSADAIGRTARLPVSLTATGRNEYEVRYRLPVPNARLDRCSLLVPSTPTDGIGRAVVIAVRLPPGARRLPGEFPAFTWDVGQGFSPADHVGGFSPADHAALGPSARITLGHIPSFVRVPYATAGEALSWRDTLDVRKLLDIASLFTIAVATVGWMALRRRTRA